MKQIMKAARLLKAEATGEDLALISAQALRPLAAEEVHTFRLAACNNQVDRDLERFTERTLEALAELFVGRPVLLDHKWSAGSQTARVYAAGVEEMPGVEGGQELLLHLADIVDGVVDENLDDAAFPRFRQLSRHLGTGNAELGGDFGLGPSLFII